MPPDVETLLADYPEQAWNDDDVLCSVAWVRFREGQNAFAADTGDLVVRPGDVVIVSGEGRGSALATVVVGSHRRMVGERMPRVMRQAHDGDRRAESTRRVRENEAARAAAKLVSDLGLEAKVVRAETATGGGRTTVFLTSEQRVDTRDLLRGLATVVPGRVEVRQMGARDAASFIGGIGPCGLQLCCNTFLADFAPVSIRMAKDQGLPLHPGRVNGVCGRLLCCLVYEHEIYRAERKRFPKIGKLVETPDGAGRVIDIDVLAGKLTVGLPDGLRSFPLEAVHVPAPAVHEATEDRASDVGDEPEARPSISDAYDPLASSTADGPDPLASSTADGPDPLASSTADEPAGGSSEP